MQRIHWMLSGIGAIALVACALVFWPGTDGNEAEIAAGRLLHEETAGGVGCASCHGMTARGEGLAPDIRGADVARITDSLKNTGDMAELAMTPHEIEQLAAYFQSIAPKATN